MKCAVCGARIFRRIVDGPWLHAAVDVDAWGYAPHIPVPESDETPDAAGFPS